MSIHDWRLLATLANTPLTRPGEIADYIATDPSTLSRMIDRFVRAGAMVRKKPAGEARITELLAQDRNSLLVGATSAGEITVARYGSMPDATLAALLLIEITARFSSKLRTLIDEIKGKV